MARDVYVRYTKYDGSLHWHFRGHELGRDEHGLWLGMPVGTVLQRGHEPTQLEPHGAALLIPGTGHWTACFNADGEAEVYVDLTSEPRVTEDEVSMIDLDLDVVRRRSDGTVFLDDEDEFIEHQAKYGYPIELVEATTKAAVELIEAVTSRTEPFDEVGPAWLARLSTTT